MKKLFVLLLLSFNAEACVVVNGYVYCPPPPPPTVIISPTITPGIPPVHVPSETGILVK
jgi:hypothetical protein